MPKERRDRSVSFDRSRVSPFPCGSSRSLLSLTKNPLENEEDVKEWESALCPVCMEHPHNAILLICSSHDNGCRPFMCDTSYRHSNCFDQYRKSSAERSETVQEEGAPVSIAQPSTDVAVSEVTVTSSQAEVSREVSTGMHDNVDNQVKGKLVCPLCRGDINGWMVVEPARIFMNSKSRSCACETCEFSGTYAELRKHARLVHPEVRPTEADPERQRDWRRLERQRDLGDLISTLQSSIGEEMVEEDSSFSLNENRLLTVFFLIRVFHPSRSSRRSSWSGGSRARAQVRRPTTRLWGESYDGESRDHDTESSDGGTGLRRSERIRRQPSSSWSGVSRARAQVRRPTTRLWGESYDGESRDHDAESSDGGTGLRRSERIRRQPTRRQQTPDES